MSESRRIADQLRRSLDGVAWHGPSLNELLNGVTAEIAAARPLTGVHSIWELVLHITFWQQVALKRVSGEAFDESNTPDWPEPGAAEEPRWRATVSEMTQSGLRLADSVSGLSDEDLKRRVPGKEYSIYFLLHGVVQHNLYHAGQIALLRKIQALQ